MKFSFVSQMSIPTLKDTDSSPFLRAAKLAFSADSSKFAIAMNNGKVSVWDIRSKVPLKTFLEIPRLFGCPPVEHLQFSSGNLGKEALVFVEVRLMFTF